MKRENQGTCWGLVQGVPRITPGRIGRYPQIQFEGQIKCWNMQKEESHDRIWTASRTDGTSSLMIAEMLLFSLVMVVDC